MIIGTLTNSSVMPTNSSWTTIDQAIRFTSLVSQEVPIPPELWQG